MKLNKDDMKKKTRIERRWDEEWSEGKERKGKEEMEIEISKILSSYCAIQKWMKKWLRSQYCNDLWVSTIFVVKMCFWWGNFMKLQLQHVFFYSALSYKIVDWHVILAFKMSTAYFSKKCHTKKL